MRTNAPGVNTMMSCWLLVVWASDPDLRTHPPNRNNNARKLKLNIVSVVSPVPSLVLLTFFLYEMFSTSLSVTEPLMPTTGLHTIRETAFGHSQYTQRSP